LGREFRGKQHRARLGGIMAVGRRVFGAQLGGVMVKAGVKLMTT